MDYKFGCAVDINGHYVIYGRIDVEDDIATESMVGYDLKPGERIVDLPYPCGLVKARVNADETGWIEAATPEEIVAWEAEHPAPPMMQSTPDPRDLALAQIMRDVAALKGGANG